jgi:hypothetical protein
VQFARCTLLLTRVVFAYILMAAGNHEQKLVSNHQSRAPSPKSERNFKQWRHLSTFCAFSRYYIRELKKRKTELRKTN